jgi:hypothetical protein
MQSELDERVVKAIEAGVSALDIMHGELKIYMLQAEAELSRIQDEEEASGEAVDSMERRYWEGILDGYSELYQLTYLLSFAMEDQDV